MTTPTAEQFNASNKANVQALEGLTTQAFSGFEKLVELNMSASKSVLSETFSHSRAALVAKDAQELMALQTGQIRPLAEKSAAYGQQVNSLAYGTGAAFTKVFDAKLVDAQTAFRGVVESLVKNAPTGTEAAVSAFKNALNVGQTVFESAENSAKIAVEVAESTFTVVTNQAVDATAAVA